jgi:hypothetical protein
MERESVTLWAQRFCARGYLISTVGRDEAINRRFHGQKEGPAWISQHCGTALLPLGGSRAGGSRQRLRVPAASGSQMKAPGFGGGIFAGDLMGGMETAL